MNAQQPRTINHILVAIGRKDHYWPLLSLGYALAKAKASRLTVLTVTPSGDKPDWLIVPSVYQDVEVVLETVSHKTPDKAVLQYAKAHPLDLILVGLRDQTQNGGSLISNNLDSILRQAPCDVIVVRAPSDWPEVELSELADLNIAVPMAGGPNAFLALDLAFALAPQAKITALNVAPEHADAANFMEHQAYLADMVAPWRGESRLKTKTIRAASVSKGLLAEAETCDIILVGATKENIFNQVIFGALPHTIAKKNKNITLIVKRVDGRIGSSANRFWWNLNSLLPALPVDEQAEVYKQVRRGARPKIDFFMMIGLAAGIAALGLLLNSPAVIIGAMLVAPLMAAIMGLGLGVIQADVKLLALAGSATVRGMALALGVGFLFGFLVPAHNPTAEILGRTQPALLDLGVALISGLAGAYALCRKNVSSSLPGVAIAAALVPPLTSSGIGLAWFLIPNQSGAQRMANLSIFSGALLLFITNLIAITAASAFVFFMLGFRPQLKRHERTVVFKRGIVSSALLLIILAFLLGKLTFDAYQTAQFNREIDLALREELTVIDEDAKLDFWETIPNTPNQETLAQQTVLEARSAKLEEEEFLRIEVQVRSPRTPPHENIQDYQKRVSERLQGQSVALTILLILTNELDPFAAPTPTATPTHTGTPTPGPTHTPTQTPTPTPTATSTASPSHTPTVLPSATPTIIPTNTATPTATGTATFTPSPTYTPTPATGVIVNTNGQGVALRWTPGGAKAGAISENSPITVLYRRETVDGIDWVEVTDSAGRRGWVAAEYLQILP